MEKRETPSERLDRLSKAGSKLSLQLRGGPFAKPEDKRSTLRLIDYGGRINDILEIAQLRGEPLLDIADVADLHMIIYPAPKIVSWGLREWRIALAPLVGPPVIGWQ